MKTFNLYGQRYKITLLTAGSISSYKKSLAYQHGIDEQGNYVNLCGKITVSRPVYVLEKSRVVEYQDYTKGELCTLLYFLEASIDYIEIPRLTEILVRGTRDKELLSYFYNDILIKRGKWRDRIGFLVNNPEAIEEVVSFPYPARFDRHKYSIYQLLKDLKKYQAKVCISEDIMEYDNITTSDRNVRGKESMFGDICEVVGNRTKANLSLMVKSEDGIYSTFCFVRDGKPHLTEFIVRADNPYLKRKLYGARIVVGSIISNNVLHLRINRLPVISRKFLRVSEGDIVNSIVQEKIEERVVNGMEHVEKKTDGNDKYEYCELKTALLEKDPGDFLRRVDESRESMSGKKELKKARQRKNDLVFRYLLSKQPKSGIFEGKKNYRARIEVYDRT